MKKKILIADDDESVRRMIGRVLESAGYAVMAAATGQEAVAKFRSGQPNLVLLDLKMPDQTGWETFEEVVHIDPLTPVIVITAWPNEYETAVAKGIDALMEKPLDLPLLLKHVELLLNETEQDRTTRLTNRHFKTAHLTAVGHAAVA